MAWNSGGAPTMAGECTQDHSGGRSSCGGRHRAAPLIPTIALLSGAVLLGGCAMMAAPRIADSLSLAIMNQDDPATVRAGAPAYLLLIDGLLEDNPQNTDLLMAGARLYAAYAVAFVEEPERAARLARKARDYGRRAACLRVPAICDHDRGPFEDFAPVLARVTAGDLPAVYTYAVGWAAWIQTQQGDWQAIAEVPKVQAMLERVLSVDEGFEQGRAHLYLGILRSQLPPDVGGKPEAGRQHFERAIALSDGRDLMAKVEFARHYARLVFDRALHDRLLEEVLAADPTAPGLTLSNTLAQDQARILLDDSAAYFGD